MIHQIHCIALYRCIAVSHDTVRYSVSNRCIDFPPCEEVRSKKYRYITPIHRDTRCIISADVSMYHRRLTRRARTPSTHCEPHELRTTAISLPTASHNVRGQLLTATSLTIARHGSHDHRHRRDWHADDATVQSGDHQLTDGVAAHGRSKYVHETR